MKRNVSHRRHQIYQDSDNEATPLVLSEDVNVDEWIGSQSSLMDGTTSFELSSSPTSSYQRRSKSSTSRTRRRNPSYNKISSKSTFELARHNKSPVENYCTCHGCCCIQCIRTNEVAVLTHFGKFHNIRNHGLLCLPSWPFTRVEKRLSLRIQQLDMVCESKTKDNVFVTLEIAILYKVDNPFKAYYSLINPSNQIQSFVFDQIRSTIPSLEVDDLYVTSQDVSLDILRSLQFFMISSYGYDIMNVLILNLYPSDLKVRNAMNEINSCKRMKEAMVNRGEAEKILQIKRAEAHSQSLYLQGIGIANERKAISKGIKETMSSFEDFNDIKASQLMNGKSVMDLLLITQYYDTLVAISANDGATTNQDKEQTYHHDLVICRSILL